MNSSPEVSSPTLDVLGGDNIASDTDVVCLGASAGGLEALQEFFEHLPSDLGVAFVVIVHLSPDFKSLMPELLGRCTNMKVVAARDDQPLEKDHVYIIPPAKNMVYAGGRLSLSHQERKLTRKLFLTIDLFLHSLAERLGSRSIVVILSGTGSDGTRGICSIKEKEGIVLAQNPETAKFNGMPTSAIQTHLVDRVGAPSELAEWVNRFINNDDSDPVEVVDDISGIISVVKARKNVDFSFLQTAMLQRRVSRRMTVACISSMSEYYRLLEADEREVLALYQDLLIGVTSFFRDQEAFDVLKSVVIPKLVEEVQGDCIRIWVAGCSNGAEAYSLGMLFLEQTKLINGRVDFKIFATDIDERALERASKGIYTLSELSNVPTGLLPRYFTQSTDHCYVVRTELREKIIFAHHNIVVDPPFIGINLISFRNLSIYFKPEVQRAVQARLFAALNESVSYLFLGSSEWPSYLESGLKCIDRKAKVFERVRDLPSMTSKRFKLFHYPTSIIESKTQKTNARDVRTQERNRFLQNILKSAFRLDSKSAAVISITSGNLVEVIADPLDLFRFPEGELSFELSQILDSQIAAAVSAGRRQLASGQTQARFEASISAEKKARMLVSLEKVVDQSYANESSELAVLLLQRVDGEVKSVSLETPENEVFDRVLFLERELRETKESLQATIEELQVSSEEQQATNEELVAANEELQSTNEELQSVNQELYTINSEYNSKNRELQVKTTELNCFLENMNVATIHLDSNFVVQKCTRSINRYISTDSVLEGQSLDEFKAVAGFDIETLLKSALFNDRVEECEIGQSGGAWTLVRALPYESPLSEKKEFLVTFTDIMRIKNAEETALALSVKISRRNKVLHGKSKQLEELFSIIAHDLKRPILGLDGTQNLAMMCLQENDPINALKNLEVAKSSLDTLKALVRDLCDVSKIGASDYVTEEIPLSKWLENIMKPFKETADKLGVQLAWLSDHGRYTFSAVPVEGIIINLVENALKYGISNTKPKINISCHVTGDRLRISVVDNGRGIAKEHHERIFQMFRRLNPEVGHGTGVGLVAVRRLAERAGGDVWVESKEGEGARFFAEVAILGAEKLNQKDEAKVLLVEDDTLDAKRVRVCLEKEGLSLQRVRSIGEALEELQSSHYHLILLDLSLPDGHGLRLLAELSEMKYETAVIILSSYTEGLLEEAMHANQVYGVVSKEQIESSTFITQVNGSLGRRSRG